MRSHQMPHGFYRVGRKLSLSLVSLMVCLLGLEIGARVIKGKPLFYFRNFVETRIDLMRSVFPIQYDARLGWTPKPGDYTDSNYWGKTLTIADQGIRLNGSVKAAPNRPAILVVGDSFTFGSQVGDEETWPAVLQELSGRRAINGGVFAYGLDQSVLRAEVLVELFKPELLIVAFIPDNVNRTERAVRTGTAKPYFDIVDGQLALRNIPVPRRDPRLDNIGFLRRVFGYSYFLDGLMRRLGLGERWYLGEWENVMAHDRGKEVGALLMRRLAALREKHQVSIVVLAQYTDELYAARPEPSSVVVEAALRAGLPVADQYEAICAVANDDPGRFDSFFEGHMTPEGNRFVAEELHRFLLKEGLLP